MKDKLTIFNEKLHYFLAMEECRTGQAIMNALSFADLEYYKQITGTTLDCFFSDKKADKSLKMIIDYLSKDERVLPIVEINTNVNINKRGENADIVFHVLAEEEMRKLGFTDHSKNSWYKCKLLSKNISFNISIDKDTSKGTIDVLDENFCQPYNYQKMIIDNTYNQFVYDTHEKVQEIMKYLSENGVISNYNRNDYI